MLLPLKKKPSELEGLVYYENLEVGGIAPPSKRPVIKGSPCSVRIEFNLATPCRPESCGAIRSGLFPRPNGTAGRASR